MAESVKIAIFDGGELYISPEGDKNREAVLALPLSRLIVQVIRVPDENRADPIAFVTPILQARSPFPDEPLSVGFETVREDGDGLVVIAAALPESATEDIANALDVAKLNITRIDTLALGSLRKLWPSLGDISDGARRLVVIPSADCLSLIVVDGDLPVSLRAVDRSANLRREAMMSLLEAEDFGGVREIKSVTVVGEIENVSELSAFGPLSSVPALEREAIVEGIAERSADPQALDALPASWREVLAETRFKSKMMKYLAIGIGIWLMVMLVLFGVPLVYGFMTDYQKSLSREHQKNFKQVSAMRDRVRLVRTYSDHNRGALEILKAVSDRMPQGVELSNWAFKRGESVRFSGEAESTTLVYQFKNNLAEIEPEVFPEIVLSGPTALRGGKYKFDLDCRFKQEED